MISQATFRRLSALALCLVFVSGASFSHAKKKKTTQESGQPQYTFTSAQLQTELMAYAERFAAGTIEAG